MLAIVATSCDKEESAIIEDSNLIAQENSIEKGLYWPWDYVMDWRYSRLECATGPGVCFRSESGDIFRFYTKGDDYVNEVNETMARLMADNPDPDNGLIVFSLVDNVLHLIFSRELEEGSFVVQEDHELNSGLAEQLGQEQIIILAGEYDVSHDNFEFGETFINIE